MNYFPTSIISKHPTMQNPRRMPLSYPAINTVSTKRNLLNSLLYFVLAGDVEAAYSRCRPSTSHDMTSVAGRVSKIKLYLSSTKTQKVTKLQEISWQIGI